MKDGKVVAAPSVMVFQSVFHLSEEIAAVSERDGRGAGV